MKELCVFVGRIWSRKGFCRLEVGFGWEERPGRVGEGLNAGEEGGKYCYWLVCGVREREREIWSRGRVKRVLLKGKHTRTRDVAFG